MESSSQEVHENLNSIIDYQTHHRLRETQVRTHTNMWQWTLIENKIVSNTNCQIFIFDEIVRMSLFSEPQASRGPERAHHDLVRVRDPRHLRRRLRTGHGPQVLLLREEAVTTLRIPIAPKAGEGTYTISIIVLFRNRRRYKARGLWLKALLRAQVLRRKKI